MRGLFWDLETNGIDTKTARITQIAFSVFDLVKQKELYHYSSLIKPSGEYEISSLNEEITGISKEQLNEFGSNFADCYSVFTRFSVLCDFSIGHNILGFDVPILTKEAADAGCGAPEFKEKIDTRFDLPIPSRIETRKLTYLAAEYGILNPGAHSARHDVLTCANLFFKFPLDEVIRRSKSPNVWLRAHVEFADKDKAKDKKFTFDSKNKWWVKNFKEIDLKDQVFNFTVSQLKDYAGP